MNQDLKEKKSRNNRKKLFKTIKLKYIPKKRR